MTTPMTTPQARVTAGSPVSAEPVSPLPAQPGLHTACIVVAGRYQPVVLRDGGRTPEPVGPSFAKPRAAIDAAVALRAKPSLA
jgi:hypothetical protein